MKKIIALLLALMCLSLVACGKKYDSRTFDILGNDFNWDMTVKDAEDYIRQQQLTSAEIKTDRNDNSTLVSDGFYIFRFDAKGKIEFVKLKINKDEAILNILLDTYGYYDKEDNISGDPYFVWYGSMGGEKTQMLFEMPSVSDYNYLEFTCK